jgi:hypothetical protein
VRSLATTRNCRRRLLGPEDGNREPPFSFQELGVDYNRSTSIISTSFLTSGSLGCCYRFGFGHDLVGDFENGDFSILCSLWVAIFIRWV